MSMINQQLIADRLKLSRATVSRCFTNHPGINPGTRAKVFALASQLGYTHLEKRAVEGAARKSAKSLTFGVIVCVDMERFDSHHYNTPGQEMLNGLSDLARGQDVRIDLHFVRPGDTSTHSPSYERIASARSRLWDGVVLLYSFPRQAVDELMATYPLVSLTIQDASAALNCVDVDHYRGIGKLVDLLHAQGHRRIGFYTWRYLVDTDWSHRRFSAYADRITALGLPFRPEDVVNIDPARYLPVEQASERVYSQTRDGVTAWICAADHQAYELIRFLKGKGLRVPQDVSVTGFDGIVPPADSPQLSTVQIPFHQIGVIGGKRLLDLIQKRFDPPQQILLACELKPGETVGPARTAPLA
jgi:DNA-binding LacI/PurR family transcriptional regulator